ncbi:MULTISPECIES: 50S ribosomal protein L30 [Candidatus Ichthyocystis]|uniref:Large ribosomal subunit protein uL30 n=1 Tax=Candidatus Ichthyocystis hellenicum TaxID=1561003 RepID=A0A0S4M5F2_9BURK|nr:MULTISPECIES: 50S ribosomal protein L30 [Ichthyocystis]CUT17368.1 50S ribosomal protein L30 [Candidatus Ichthyocystis hellenicum]
MSTKEKKLLVRLVRSLIGVRSSHRSTVRCLGLNKLGSSREFLDTPTVRGMVDRVSYLVDCSEFEG